MEGQMMLKNFLLGTSAVLLMVGGASAADLTVAEPVDYVKVCDAFGKGFFYSPGTDTCIKIGGYVKFKTQATGGTDDNDLDAAWGAFYTEASLQITASSVTEYGNLTGYYELRTRAGSSYTRPVGSDTNTYIKNAYLQLGGLKAGHFTSYFDFGRGYTDTGMFGSDVETDHIQYTYALGSFALTLALEDGSDRDRSSALYGSNDASVDVQAGLTYVAGPASFKLVGAYVPNQIDDIDGGWAIGGSGELSLDQFAKGDKFVVNAAYGDNAPSYTGVIGGTSLLGSNKGNVGSYDGNSWSVLASYKHIFTPQVWGALSAGYIDSDAEGNAWRTAVNVDWAPAKGLDLLAEGVYTDADLASASTWQANLFLKRSW
jgi:hypothetical protein